MSLTSRHPWVPYVVPFVTFMVLLALREVIPVPPRVGAIFRVGVMTIVILALARPLVSFRATRPAATIGIGLLVFLLWIAPDELFPGYRSSWLFQNGIVGKLESSVKPEARSDIVYLALRTIRGVLIVPIVEELFWRGWLPRWLDRMDDFLAVPLGTFSRLSFWGTAVLFGLEHGSLWDVGLVAGVIYNWWMVRTRNLGDLMLAHAVTNGCLAVWVLGTGQWQYW